MIKAIILYREGVAEYAAPFSPCAYGVHTSRGQESIISISPDMSHMMVLKYEKMTGKVTTYLNQKFCFARVSDQFPYTANKDLKMQWLTDDICAVTYTSPDDGNVHQYVMTYGDRGDGIRTYHVQNAILGTWTGKGKNFADWKIEKDSAGIIIRSAFSEEIYTFDDCVQFGSVALALCRDGLPQWTLVLDENCVIGENDLLEEGTITLCKVTMEKSAPMQFSGREKLGTFDDTGDKERGRDLQKEMKKILKQDPALSKYKSDTSEKVKVKVLTDSEDVFWITRSVMEEVDKQQAVNGLDVDVRIQHMELLAGDRFDYLMKVKFIKSYSIVSDSSDPSYIDMEVTYRIMKGRGAYLAFRIGYDVDGSIGMNPPAMRQEKYTADDKTYSYIVPAVKDETGDRD